MQNESQLIPLLECIVSTFIKARKGIYDFTCLIRHRRHMTIAHELNEALHLQIVADRVRRHRARSLAVWNSSPGALAVNLSFSDYLPHFPFYLTSLGISPNPR